MKKSLLITVAGLALAVGSAQAQVAISVPGYTQDFDGISAGLPTGWDVRTGATATSLGSTATFNTSATGWGITTGSFRNSAASTGFVGTESDAVQAGSTDRAVGLRQTAGFGDPGASFNFHFSTIGVQITQISLDLMMLSVQPRSTTWSLEYGLGSSPSSFTTLGTYSDPGLFGSTTFTFTTGDFGSALDNQSDIWFRVVALSASTGSGTRDTVGIDNFAITAIPEPSTYALLALGLGTLIFLRRRKTKARA